MMTKNELKFIQALDKRSERYSTGLFVGEGEKLIEELVEGGLEIAQIFATKELRFETNAPFEIISCADMERISNLKTATAALALVKMPKVEAKYKGGLALVLDTVQDPGNLGTIIRVAAWYGVTQIFCSLETADCYSPKVIQATMGAIANMEMIYTDLSEFLQEQQNIEIYGTFLENAIAIYDLKEVVQDAFLVMGNEGNGISKKIEECVTKRLFLPPFGEAIGAESLNVGVATAVSLSELRRKA